MDPNIATFLAFTASSDPVVAKQFLDISCDNLEYAVQLFMESTLNQAESANDEALAQRLQSEAYADGGVREADSNVHRHETLLDSFPSHNTHIPDPDAIFGGGRVGIFNQRFGQNGTPMHNFEDDEEQELVRDDDRVVDLDSFEYEYEDNYIEIDSDEEPVSGRVRRTLGQRSRTTELTSTQRRLAELFKPPFELISRTSLEGARKQGREEKKWILINIQDQAEFRCQVLNRDFWSDSEVKEMVRNDFIFLQYQHDSPHGQSYSNFYSVDDYPHIAILDPITGERVYTWLDGTVPKANSWVGDVLLFMGKYSLQPGSRNPAVKNESRIDPDAMSEEQQIEYAMKQSAENAKSAQQSESSAQSEIDIPPQDTQDPFQAIPAKDHSAPDSGPSTRIQIRFPNGKRLVHKFSPVEDKVITIYGWLKFVLTTTEEGVYGFGNEDFTISCPGKPKLIENLDKTVKEAGLMNASILIEKS